ncbi:MAG: glycosyltransferase [Bacteroidia bacterium]|jgi:glycosyltransferase involved in cell wall biosynthesis
MIADPNWHAGNIYIQNIIHAIQNLTPKERADIHLSITTRRNNSDLNTILPHIDQVFIDTIFHLGFYKILQILPAFLRFPLFNFRKIDFYYPAGNLPKKWLFKWGGWIPDFQYRYLPQLFSDDEYRNRENRNSHLAKESPVLAFSSQCAMDDYIKFFPKYKGNEFLLRFVSNANENWLRENPVQYQLKFQLPDQFFIVCNQFWKHKDHGTIIDAIHILKQKGIIIHVVCTGSTEDFRNPEYFPDLLKKAEELEVKDQFIVLGFISRNEQIQLIRRSLAIIQPSLFEGWSTVVEDGRSLGKSIFLSDFSVHVEQNPPFTWYFEQRNAIQLATLIEEHNKELTPGPDLQKEKQAFKLNHEMMADFGRRFIEMARKANAVT